MTLDEFKEKEDLRKKRYYKALEPHKKHMALMYFLRLQTDFENIECYVETYRYRQYQLSENDFPDFIFKLSPEDLRAEAYEAIGKVYKEA